MFAHVLFLLDPPQVRGGKRRNGFACGRNDDRWRLPVARGGAGGRQARLPQPRLDKLPHQLAQRHPVQGRARLQRPEEIIRQINRGAHKGILMPGCFAVKPPRIPQCFPLLPPLPVFARCRSRRPLWCGTQCRAGQMAASSFSATLPRRGRAVVKRQRPNPAWGRRGIRTAKGRSGSGGGTANERERGPTASGREWTRMETKRGGLRTADVREGRAGPARPKVPDVPVPQPQFASIRVHSWFPKKAFIRGQKRWARDRARGGRADGKGPGWVMAGGCRSGWRFAGPGP